MTRLKPADGIKSSYGILKLHKESAPLRPIITSYGSVTSNAEKFLLDLIRPIRDMCTYSVKNIQGSKENFLKNRHKFVIGQHIICSFDASSLFTSINATRSILMNSIRT